MGSHAYKPKDQQDCLDEALYQQAYIKIEAIKKDLYRLAGLMIPAFNLEISDQTGKFSGYRTEAEMYRFGIDNPVYKIVIYDKDGLLKSVKILAHEMYHILQEEYRRINEGLDPATQHIGETSDLRTKILRDGVDEAGACIYGFRSELKEEGFEGEELGIKVLQRMIQWSKTTISSCGGEVLDLFFADKSKKPEAESTENINYTTAESLRRKAKITLIVAAIIIEQNGFDVDKAAKQLLQDPDKTIDEIVKMGRENVIRSLDTASKFLGGIEMEELLIVLRENGWLTR